MLRIDGSKHSGSGTIFRTALAMAAILGERVEVFHIREKRDPPGLRAQHVATARALAELTEGRLVENHLGSRRVIFEPGTSIRGGDYEWRIPGAGSAVLMAMALLPVAMYASKPSTYRIEGGIFQDFAPTGYFLKWALLPLLREMGLEADLEIERPGYAPKGRGILRLSCQPLSRPLQALRLGPCDRSDEPLGLVQGWSLSSHLKKNEVSERLARSCREALRGRGLYSEFQLVFDHTAAQPGAALFIRCAHAGGGILAADGAGAKGRPSERIGRRVANRLFEDVQAGGSIDRFLADQLLPYAALAAGLSQYRIPRETDHVESACWLCDELLGAPVSRVERELKIQGIGLQPDVAEVGAAGN